LKRLLALHKLYFFKSKPEHLLPLEGEVAREVQETLSELGYYNGQITGVYDEATRQALFDFSGIENLGTLARKGLRRPSSAGVHAPEEERWMKQEAA